MKRKRFRADLARTLRAILSKTPYRLVNKEQLERTQRALAAVGRLRLDAPKDSGEVRAIVFSRDRPLQLHALLSGYFDCFDEPPPVRVLYSVSNERAAAAYSELSGAFPDRDLELVHEVDFRENLLRELEQAGDSRIFFLVDDIVFLESIAAADLKNFPASTHILSLRLAPQIEFSYTMQSSQRPPGFQEFENDKSRFSRRVLEWNWKGGEIDWGYAFSVDGHVFRAREILELARGVDFRAPNSFESVMQVYAPYFAARKGLCYERPALVNVPCNRVQNEVDNVHGTMHQDRLLELWEGGSRVDFRKLYGAKTDSCHQEMALPLHTPVTKIGPGS
ncbi:MAG: hypothetical protein RIF32_02740 [Leptospirales bacterium]|jgi:hypothetical protein